MGIECVISEEPTSSAMNPRRMRHLRNATKCINNWNNEGEPIVQVDAIDTDGPTTLNKRLTWINIDSKTADDVSQVVWRVLVQIKNLEYRANRNEKLQRFHV